MAGPEPGKGIRRLAVGIAVIVAAASAVVFVARRPDPAPVAEPAAPALKPSDPSVPSQAAEPQPPANPPLERTGVLGRAGLLEIARSAAAAYAEGATAPADVAGLAGRRFQLRTAFGCNGPSAPEAGASASWSIGPKGETLRISVRPEVWTDSPFAEIIGGATVEAVEGFWLPRPWQASETCPGRRSDPLLAEVAAPSPQTVGLATIYGPDSSRLSRRGERGYELTLPLAEAARPGAQGLHLELAGRIAPFADGRTVACRSASPEQRPVCLIGAQFERVAIRHPESGRLLGEWLEPVPLSPGPTTPPASRPATAAQAPPG